MGGSQTIRRGQLLFDVIDEGEGPAVVLLHGFPQDSSCWDEVVPHLHAAGLRTIRIDQRGYSTGARPMPRAAYRLEFLTSDVLAVLDTLALPRAHVVGHDWGGIVAWALAASAPTRVQTVTAVSTPHPGAISRAVRHSAQAWRSTYVLAFQLPVLPELVLRSRAEQLLIRMGLPAAHARRYAARMREPGAARAALHWYRALPLSRRRIGDCPVPATLLWGSKDPALGRHAAEGTAHHVAGPFRFEPLDAGHWLPETHPRRVAEAILGRVGAPGAS